MYMFCSSGHGVQLSLHNLWLRVRGRTLCTCSIDQGMEYNLL